MRDSKRQLVKHDHLSKTKLTITLFSALQKRSDFGFPVDIGHEILLLFSLFQAPREKREGEGEGTKTRGPVPGS